MPVSWSYRHKKKTHSDNVMTFSKGWPETDDLTINPSDSTGQKNWLKRYGGFHEEFEEKPCGWLVGLGSMKIPPTPWFVGLIEGPCKRLSAICARKIGGAG